MPRLWRRLGLGFVLIGCVVVSPASGQPYDPTQAELGAAPSHTALLGTGYETILIDPPEALPTSTTQACAVNNAGEVLGDYSRAGFIFCAGAIWQDGGLTTACLPTSTMCFDRRRERTSISSALLTLTTKGG